MAHHLFDPIPRLDQRYRRRSESAYRYLNESARPEAVDVRLLYREWLKRYPRSERADLVRRFRLDDGRAHTAAAFELVLHEALRGLGASVSVVPPGQPGSRHDFDVVVDGEATAIEATLVTDESDDDMKKKERENRLLDVLDERRHERLAVHIWECRVNGDRQPSFQCLRNGMFDILNQASDDQIAQWAGMVASRNYTGLPRWTYERDGTKVVFSPVPVTPGAAPMYFGPSFRGQLVNLHPPTAMKRVTIGDAVLEKIQEKVRKGYQVGSRPLVLALAITNWSGCRDDDVFRALLGTERWPVVEQGGKSVLGDPFRDCDGIWAPHSHRRSSSVSAVLLFSRFHVWEPWEPNWRAYLNPWARTPPPRWLRRLPHWAEGSDGEFEPPKQGVELKTVLLGS